MTDWHVNQKGVEIIIVALNFEQQETDNDRCQPDVNF